MPRTTPDYKTPAQQATGNWRKFESFVWHRQPDDAENWCIVYTNNRDSKLLEQSNAEAIQAEMEEFTQGDDPDCISERHDHWAVGWTDGYSIRVYRGKETTPAFERWCDIQNRLSDYPVLDDEDYSQKKYDATIENIERGADQIISQRDLEEKIPTNYAEELYEWFSENLYRAIENRDDDGGYPSDKELEQAFRGLGWFGPKMKPGYCFELNGSSDWEHCSNDLWDAKLYDPTGDQEFVGVRQIDCSTVSVFAYPIMLGAVQDGTIYRAQLQIVTG